jgi:glutamate formiminotransferase/formiminotetrahydrofolate cyclodeaminase
MSQTQSLPASQALVECVPNFSEGRDPAVIEAITAAIASAEGVRLLDVDPGRATNRTVVTFVGPPEAVIEGAFRGIAMAAERIDMRQHQGEHPRMGATDVCPLVPVAGISMDEVAELSRRLARRVGQELGIPVYLYEAAASRPERRNLATIRAGEYEGLEEKLAHPDWQPDFGPARFHAGAGATVIGARDFLVAYNLNLNSKSTRRAFALAFDLREQGRQERVGDPLTGELAVDEAGRPLWIPGRLKAVKAIGWYIEEYGIAQVSMNLTDLRATPLHEAFEAGRECARQRGLRVTGSELVGMIPLAFMLEAGRFYLRRQERSLGIPEREIIQIAVKSMGLDELAPFDPDQKIIEYRMRQGDPAGLVGLSLAAFGEATASEAPAPGGGSISAYAGSLAAALGAMVANVSANKRGWDARWEHFSAWAERGEALRVELLELVDADSRAFDAVLEAFRLPSANPAETHLRDAAIEVATQGAIEVPFRTMSRALAVMDLLRAMVDEGAPDAVSDAGVGALCARAAVRGAWLNVQINTTTIADRAWADARLSAGAQMAAAADEAEREILNRVALRLGRDPVE